MGEFLDEDIVQGRTKDFPDFSLPWATNHNMRDAVFADERYQGSGYRVVFQHDDGASHFLGELEDIVHATLGGSVDVRGGFARCSHINDIPRSIELCCETGSLAQ